MRAIKKYWSGNIRLLSDFVWSSIFSIILSFFAGNPRGIFDAPLYFFLFFFWSWNEQHVTKKFAKWVIHLLCWAIFLIGYLSPIIAFTEREKRFKNWEDWIAAIFLILFATGIAIKYKSIMWPKKPVPTKGVEAEQNPSQEQSVEITSTRNGTGI